MTGIRAWARRLLGPTLPLPRTLVRCPACNAHRVVPIDYDEEGEQQWWMALRCGECGETREVVASDEEAHRFGVALDRGVREIEAELARLEGERMADESRRFADALERDLIDASDFER